jgi:hypothetical protein
MATVDELLQRSSPEVRAIALRLREVIRETLPDALESVDLPDNLLAFGSGGRLRDLVVGIIPHSAHVNVQFADAVDLPDPAGLLQGTGKRIRHVKNRSVVDADRTALRALVRAQWQHHLDRLSRRLS